MNEGDAVRAGIADALREVERAEGVRVSFAVEPGGRAWGFSSRDGDWDVRFLHVRPLAAYPGVVPPGDGIERPIVDGLDPGGWDPCKALGSLVRSDAAALQWLSSPIVHRRDGGVAAEPAGLARIAAHRPALECRYSHLARGARPPADGAPARLEALFRVSRPALAPGWLRRVGAPSPMHVPSFMAGLAPPSGSVEAIKGLRARKAAGTGADPAPPCPEAEAFVVTVWRLGQSARRRGTRHPPSPWPTPCSRGCDATGIGRRCRSRGPVRACPRPSCPGARGPTPLAPRLRSKHA